MTVIASSTFLTNLSSPTMPYGTHQVDVCGQPVWFRVRRRNSAAVVFTFQGTIDRAETPVPVYGTDLSSSITNATLIGISDPALDTFPAPLGSGWYAGWQGCDLQSKLGSFFPQIVSALGATRVIFQGSSAGGFAALYYGSLIANSIVIALNPQTRLDFYDWTDKYRTACWPNLGTAPLSSVIDCDLVSKYATAFDNHVIYLLNDGDLEHVYDHHRPFYDAIDRGKHWRFVDRKLYGRNDHVAIPESLWTPWVAAAVNAARSNASDVKALMRDW